MVAVSSLPAGINTSTAVAKNASALGGATGAILQTDPFNLGSVGTFSYEFDVQRQGRALSTVAVGFGTQESKGPAYVGINRGAFAIRTEAYGDVAWLHREPNVPAGAVPDNWYRVKVEIDLATRSLIAVAIKDLTGGDPDISVEDFQPLYIGDDAKSQRMETFFSSDPGTWDTVFIRTGEQEDDGSGWVDNIEASVTHGNE
jgi:hypothetical protein